MIEQVLHHEQKIIILIDSNMYENSNKIFIGRFENKVSKAGKEYMQFSLSPEDIANIEKHKNEK